jgi:diguanylate cyclase (GGDEF)-like protein/PAS domain S-box-containing protein
MEGEMAKKRSIASTPPAASAKRPPPAKEFHDYAEDIIEDATERKPAEHELVASEIRYRRLFETAKDGILLLDADTGQITDVNPFLIQLLGYSRSEIVGKKLWEIGPFKDMEASQSAFRALQEQEYIRYEDLPLQTKDGRRREVEFVSNVYRVGSQKVIQCNVRDITERKRAEAALEESEERYALAARGANDGLWDWKLKTNEIYFSPRWKSILGGEGSEIGNSPDEWFHRVHPEDIDRVKADIASHLEGLTPHFETEYRMRHKDGTYRWMRSRGLAVREAQGRAYRMAGSLSDITGRKRAEEQLVHDACHDALTGLPNRALFIDRMGHAIKLAKRRADYFFAMLFLDLDRFKVINDSLGHTLGDQLLVAIARRLEPCLRPADTVARLGGDEFAILLDDIKDASDATRVAERIQKELTRPFPLSGHEVFTSASIGIALSATGYDRPEDVLRDADMAMYRAKALGQARYEMFDTGMHARAVALLQLEADLRRAVERQELRIHYQPIVSLASGRMTGVEALVRWQHPQRGLVLPAEFIPPGEETGPILSISEWVLRTACAQNKAWQEAGYAPLCMAVNLPARHFQQPGLPELIKNVLKETGMPAQALALEITEGTVMKSIDFNLATLNDLRALGIQISIDDFGTGYSSLGYLKRFPFHTLKIDQSFVKDMASDSEDAAITTAIIAMAHSLKLKVVAEGVETEEQLAILRSEQCDEIQGYLFSRPVPAETFTKLLQEARCLAPELRIKQRRLNFSDP